MIPHDTLVRVAYLAVFAGTFAEGETVLVLGGLLAQEKRVSFPGILGAAFLGAYSGHIFWFWAGRRHGPALLARFPRLKLATGRAMPMLERERRASLRCWPVPKDSILFLLLLIGTSTFSRVRGVRLSIASWQTCRRRCRHRTGSRVADRRVDRARLPRRLL